MHCSYPKNFCLQILVEYLKRYGLITLALFGRKSSFSQLLQPTDSATYAGHFKFGIIVEHSSFNLL